MYSSLKNKFIITNCQNKLLPNAQAYKIYYGRHPYLVIECAVEPLYCKTYLDLYLVYMAFMGCGFTSGGHKSGSVFGAAVC